MGAEVLPWVPCVGVPLIVAVIVSAVVSQASDRWRLLDDRCGVGGSQSGRRSRETRRTQEGRLRIAGLRLTDPCYPASLTIH